MKNLLAAMYEAHHEEKRKYGFAHHLTMKGKFFKSFVGNGKRVLDAGSRDGTLTETFSAANSVTCIDIDERAVRLCGERLGVTALQHDLNCPLPFVGGSFDAVVAADVLEHVVLGEEFIKEVLRVLVPGGIFLGSTPNAFYWSNRIIFFLGNDPHDFLDPTHVRHFSLNSLKRMLSQKFSQPEVIPYGHHQMARLLPTWFAGDFFWRALK